MPMVSVMSITPGANVNFLLRKDSTYHPASQCVTSAELLKRHQNSFLELSSYLNSLFIELVVMDYFVVFHLFSP